MILRASDPRPSAPTTLYATVILLAAFAQLIALAMVAVPALRQMEERPGLSE